MGWFFLLMRRRRQSDGKLALDQTEPYRARKEALIAVAKAKIPKADEILREVFFEEDKAGDVPSDAIFEVVSFLAREPEYWKELLLAYFEKGRKVQAKRAAMGGLALLLDEPAIDALLEKAKENPWLKNMADACIERRKSMREDT